MLILNLKNILPHSFIFVLVFTSSLVFSQTKYNTTYAKEFKEIKKNSYTTKLITLSEVKPTKSWNNYKGGPINTTDTLFFFNKECLLNSFPTNASKIRNEYLAYYFALKSEKCPTLFSLLNYFEPIIQQQLKATNLPQELKLLPAVCSAFNPNSTNGLGGEGYWHLNHPQAIKYGLTIDGEIDERKDFEKSTAAALHYLKDLHAMYNDWELTIAAYSSGVTNVNKLLKRNHTKKYKDIYPLLPEETRDLVQAFVAMIYIYNYDDYGAVKLNPIVKSDTIFIDRGLKFEAINHVINSKSDEFAFLNPTLCKEIFPANFIAHLPIGTKDKLLAFKDSIYFYQDSVLLKPISTEPEYVIPKDGEPVVYTVRLGDVLGVIAERYNVRVSQIQAWNGLAGTRIDIGQKLTIYGDKKTVNNDTPKPKKEKGSEPKKPKKEPKPIKDKGVRATYTVKSGDNLWIIAKKYSGISAQNIMDYNGIDENLKVGQVLKIPKK